MRGKLAMCVHMGACETRREWFSGEGCRTGAEDWRNVPRTSSGARSHEALYKDVAPGIKGPRLESQLCHF